MTRRLLLLLLVPVMFACSNTGSARRAVSSNAAPGRSIKVSLREYRNSLRFSIVNDGFLIAVGVEGETPDLRRAAFYSDRSSDSSSKVVPDEVMDGILEFLDDQGFSQRASEGPAPPEQASAQHLSTSIEVVVDGRARGWLFDPAWASGQELTRIGKQYIEARDGLMVMYQRISQFKAADPADLNFQGVNVRNKAWR